MKGKLAERLYKPLRLLKGHLGECKLQGMLWES